MERIYYLLKHFRYWGGRALIFFSFLLKNTDILALSGANFQDKITNKSILSTNNALSKALFSISETYFDASEAFFDASETVFDASKTFFDASETFFTLAKTFFDASETFFTLSKTFFVTTKTIDAPSEAFDALSEANYYYHSRLRLKFRSALFISKCIWSFRSIRTRLNDNGPCCVLNSHALFTQKYSHTIRAPTRSIYEY